MMCDATVDALSGRDAILHIGERRGVVMGHAAHILPLPEGCPTKSGGGRNEVM